MTVDASLLSIVRDSVGSLLLTHLNDRQRREIADEIVSRDVYSYRTVITAALNKVLLGNPFDAALVGSSADHLLWCNSRTAQWKSHLLTSVPEWQLQNTKFVDETLGKPTVVITPMTMCMHDVLSGLCAAFGTSREIIVYGENISEDQISASQQMPNNVKLVGTATSSISIFRALQRGAVFCTYADFVYQNHKSLIGSLFGVPRPFSSAFLAMCAHKDAFLLPVILFRTPESAFNAVFSEPMIIKYPEFKKTEYSRKIALHVVSSCLEQQIKEVPEQWLLLPTLSAEVNYSYV